MALPQDEIISSRRSAQSILDLMLREHLPTPSAASKERPNGRNLSEIDEAVILSNIKNLLVGGHGTTTDSICQPPSFPLCFFLRHRRWSKPCFRSTEIS
ncbi:hypothetical protein CGGC5_v004545 [Colletotrichum fructicola Nara gc5]|uniref:Uncharacterized protein n=1 Tax=Colletotrichum fructicola (strain Nara gc5) TaxID=1213859 RepID=A0A7J6JK43_COLFN|nr:hypothetical protein CGGC5_v004545 [Colletotrichum fructicola Nara gc5]